LGVSLELERPIGNSPDRWRDLGFNPNGTVELKIYEFFFQLDELEPEKKEKLSSAVREAIVGHWLDFINSCGLASRRSLSSSNAFESYHSQICDLTRPRNVNSCPFEFREIAGERLRFHHPSGQVAIKINNSYFPLSEVPRAGQKKSTRACSRPRKTISALGGQLDRKRIGVEHVERKGWNRQRS
jgi:hypothetical protein